MKKALLFPAIILMALMNSVKAQTTNKSNKTITYNKTTIQASPVNKVQTRYRAISSGAAIPLGSFANNDFAGTILEASGAKTGSLAEYSNLRVFGTKKDKTYYYGLYTQATAYFNPIRYNLPSDNYYSEEETDKLHTFPAAELKLGPAIVFPINNWLLADVNANLGITMAVPLLLGYSHYEENTNGWYRTVTSYHLFGEQALAVSMIGGLGGNIRIGNVVAGIDLNFGKLKFLARRGEIKTTYSADNNTLISTEDISSESYNDKMRLTSLRLKIGVEW